jgi:NADH:ubiquinone reductase (non-electrogenic)
MDCIDVLLKCQSKKDIKRLLHVVVVGGGPTGVESAAEIRNFYKKDLKTKIPSIKDYFPITLIEAHPNVRMRAPIRRIWLTS